MPKNNIRKKIKNDGIFYKFLISVIFGIIVFLLIVIICSVCIFKAPYPKENTLVYALISIIVSSFSASFFHCFRERKNGLATGVIIGIIMTLIYYLIFTAFSSFRLNNNALLIIPSGIAPSSIAGIIAVNIRKK